MVYIIHLVLFLGVAEASCPYCCSFNGNPCGEFLVKSKDVYIGETVNFTCRLYEPYMMAKNKTALDMYFTTDSGVDDARRGIQVNESVAILQHVVSRDDYMKIFFCEMAGAMPIERIELDIEYYPHNVTNFSCIYEDLLRLHCSWEHPVKYLHTRDMRTTFEWGNDGKSFSQCPDQHELLTHCGNITNNIYGGKTYFRVNVTYQKTHVTASKLIALEKWPNTLRNKYGKPLKMKSLMVVEKGKTSMELQWDSASTAGVYYVLYNSSDGVKNVTTYHKSVHLENLTAYTTYRIEVVGQYIDLVLYQIMKKKIPVGIPSDPVVIYQTTLQDVAPGPPNVTEGGFTENFIEPSETRNITIYWQNFDGIEKNGPIIEYEILFNIDGKESLTERTDSTDQLTQYTLANVPISQSGFVTIKAGTKVGMSESSLPIYIPKSADSFEPPEMLLEIYNVNNNNRFDMLITWQNNDLFQPNATGYTVYWCESTLHVVCQSQVHWINIEPGKSQLNLTNLYNTKNYLFGVSKQVKNISSGFSWESCFYQRDSVPEQPDPVQIQGQDETSVTVMWTIPTCVSLQSSPFIQYYILYWCRIVEEDGEDCQLGVENATLYRPIGKTAMMNYKINNLETDKRYAVWLQAVSTAGKISPLGYKNYNATTIPLRITAQVAESYKVVIILVVVIVIAFLLACLCMFTKFRERLYNECCVAYKIDVPKIPQASQKILEPPSIPDRRPDGKKYHSDIKREDSVVYDNPSLDTPESLDNNNKVFKADKHLFLNLAPANDYKLDYMKHSEMKQSKFIANLDYHRIKQNDSLEKYFPQDSDSVSSADILLGESLMFPFNTTFNTPQCLRRYSAVETSASEVLTSPTRCQSMNLYYQTNDNKQKFDLKGYIRDDRSPSGSGLNDGYIPHTRNLNGVENTGGYDQEDFTPSEVKTFEGCIQDAGKSLHNETNNCLHAETNNSNGCILEIRTTFVPRNNNDYVRDTESTANPKTNDSYIRDMESTVEQKPHDDFINDKGSSVERKNNDGYVRDIISVAIPKTNSAYDRNTGTPAIPNNAYGGDISNSSKQNTNVGYVRDMEYKIEPKTNDGYEHDMGPTAKPNTHDGNVCDMDSIIEPKTNEQYVQDIGPPVKQTINNGYVSDKESTIEPKDNDVYARGTGSTVEPITNNGYVRDMGSTIESKTNNGYVWDMGSTIEPITINGNVRDMGSLIEPKTNNGYIRDMRLTVEPKTNNGYVRNIGFTSETRAYNIGTAAKLKNCNPSEYDMGLLTKPEPNDGYVRDMGSTVEPKSNDGYIGYNQSPSESTFDDGCFGNVESANNVTYKRRTSSSSSFENNSASSMEFSDDTSQTHPEDVHFNFNRNEPLTTAHSVVYYDNHDCSNISSVTGNIQYIDQNLDKLNKNTELKESNDGYKTINEINAIMSLSVSNGNLCPDKFENFTDS